MKMKPIVSEVLKLIRSTTPSTIRIVKYIRSEGCVIKADPTQIHQIVLNLTTNAFHAMEGLGGTLTVGLKEIETSGMDIGLPGMPAGTYACLSVEDTGSGMEKELINKIFDPFFTTKEKDKGTGMGLSVVHGIVSGMNGFIKVDSEPGKGSLFQVFIPVEKGDDLVAEPQPMAQLPRGSEHILLVDDEESVAHMEKRLLERLGYKVTVFTSGTEALDAFRDDPDRYDLIVSDMTMPNMPGDLLSVEILKIRPGIPILICTGFSQSLTKKRARELGIRSVLAKPVVMKDFARTIRAAFDESPDQADAREHQTVHGDPSKPAQTI